jgi:hypothetical protein
MILSEIQADIQETEEETALFEKTNFNSRAEAIDFVDFHVINRIEGLLQKEDCKEELNILKLRADKLKFELEKIDTDLFQQLREKIRDANDKRALFKQIIQQYAGISISDINNSPEIGYDNLDIFINGLLTNKAIPNAIRELEQGMIFYQKTPARIIFELVEKAGFKPNDVFFDLGCGFGQVVILVHLLAGIAAKGVEYEPAFCEYAANSARALNLNKADFINTDARQADFSDGTVFFMFTPFVDDILRDVLALLQKESLSRKIKLFTYGPCTTQVASQKWLYADVQDYDDYKLHLFKSY